MGGGGGEGGDHGHSAKQSKIHLPWRLHTERQIITYDNFCRVSTLGEKKKNTVPRGRVSEGGYLRRDLKKNELTL